MPEIPSYSSSYGNDPVSPASTTPEIESPITRKIDTAATRRAGPREPASTRSLFNGNSVPIQLKLDSELIDSLKLIAVSSKKSMSEIVMECLTSNSKIKKTWTTTRHEAA